MLKWMGRVALVTGASSGIGAAICEDLVKHGMKVVGAARREERMQCLAEKLKNEKGSFLPVKCDVTKDDDVIALFDKIKETFGGVDVCVNNAGIIGTGLNLLNGTTEEWRQIIDVNVIALCLCSKLTVKSIKERGLDDGHIINISSMAGHHVYPFEQFHFYTGSKFAVRALSEALRQEIQAAKSGIRVSVVSPGLVKTEVLNNASADPVLSKMYENYNSLKSEDIARTVSQILAAPSYMEVHDTIVSPR
ncbi:Dehydrogenase/reductase SDR family member 11 [Armadillidium vulgare]|nr:Dehydrogenase/reductase SDR family member 11 [Armadillidium vulgare]